MAHCFFDNSEIISWRNLCDSLEKIMPDSYHLETIEFTNKNSREIFIKGNQHVRPDYSESTPTKHISYLHKDGFLIRYKDENNFDSKFSLIYILEIYGKDEESIEKFTIEVGLTANLEANLSRSK